jgi:hypothetical protein
MNIDRLMVRILPSWCWRMMMVSIAKKEKKKRKKKKWIVRNYDLELKTS